MDSVSFLVRLRLVREMERDISEKHTLISPPKMYISFNDL